MNLFRRCLFLFLCFPLLFLVFSVNVSASDEIDLSKIMVTHSQNIMVGSDVGFLNLGSVTFFPNNNIVEKDTFIVPISYLGGEPSYNSFQTSFYIENNDGSALVSSGRNVSISFENVFNSIFLESQFNIPQNYWGFYLREASTVKCLVYYRDGRQFYIDDVGYYQVPGEEDCSFSFSFLPEFDVLAIEMIILHENVYCNGDIFINNYLGEFRGDSYFSIEIVRSSEEAGLLGGLIEWVKSIFESVKNTFNAIIELPSKLWGLISDGLKSLFVPSEEYIEKFKTDMDSMLSTKLGAIYQVVDITLNSWDRIQANDETNTIDFPRVSISLPDNVTFEFGGQSVQIVPDGFDFLVSALKTIVGISCTVLFINGLKKRYDEVMGGKE